jgi:hypothetical protein
MSFIGSKLMGMLESWRDRPPGVLEPNGPAIDPKENPQNSIGEACRCRLEPATALLFDPGGLFTLANADQFMPAEFSSPGNKKEQATIPQSPPAP